MSVELAMLFPGQGSQSVGMLAELAAAEPLVCEVFAEASETLGLDLWRLAQEGPLEELGRTEMTQPAMLAAGISVWRVWRARAGVTPAAMAGHSFGEYTALVAAGALAFSDAVALVAERGRLMQGAVAAGAGAMAAVLGLDDDRVLTVCAEAAQGEVVEAANFNAPGQVVIAGHAGAVERAAAAAKEAGAKRVMPLAVSVPAHCSLMRPAAERLGELLAGVTIAEPEIPVIHNVDVSAAARPDEIRQRLIAQLYSPVRWVETIVSMRSAGTQICIEAGPGKVLSGLNKRIDKSFAAYPVFDPDSLGAALEASNA